MTPATLSHAELTAIYGEAEQEFLKEWRPEPGPEAVVQATQRKITAASFDHIHARRPDVQCFTGLMVQYPRPGTRTPGQVVPDNLVVVHPAPIEAGRCFRLFAQPVGPLVALEYQARSRMRTDFQGNTVRYEHYVRVPYYVLFDVDKAKLSVFRLTDGRYRPVTPNAAGRFPIPELETEVALSDRWVRYWFRGELVPLPADLLPLPADLLRSRDEIIAERDQIRGERDVAVRRAADAVRELERLRAELARRSTGGD